MLQIVHVTDPHFGCEDAAALKAVAAYVNETKPDVVICTGDLSKDGLQHELDNACAWLSDLSAPVILTPGNHDVPYYDMAGRLLYPWTRFERAAHGLRTQAWHAPQWSIVPINTARAWQLRLNWAQGEISRGQTALAAAELQKGAPGALRIIATHHPLDWPSDAPIRGVTRGGARALHQLSDAGAELFLAGHLHFASARLVGAEALAVTSGTLSRRLRHEPCAFMVIRRPAPDALEAEVLFVVQGVCETASKRRFALNAPLAPGAAIHARD